MKKFLVLACATVALSLTVGNVLADDIKGRIGITGKMGVLFPADGDHFGSKTETDAGFVFGGGLIYGITKNIAADIDVTRSFVESNDGDFGVTNLSLGGQYRFALSQPQLVPYLGAGLDILLNDADRGRYVDNTVGVHASAGVDYFFTKQLALTGEAKLVVSPSAHIRDSSDVRVGTFDPNSISMTAGIRYFFN